ncbi:hypothetical protein Tco_1106835 [Tanacetum coccineum]
MENLKFVNTHNMVAFLSKPEESDGFEQIVDFLNAHPIKYALIVNHTIYISCIEQFWSTVKAKTINGEVQLHALVDGKKIIITELTVRRDLQLEDAEGVDCLPNSTIFEQLTLIGKPKRKDTQIPQSSDLNDNVVDEAVHKELGDSLVRAATTTSSLEAKQDSGNITKTRSKATPNESSTLETTLGGGPRGNTLRSDEDRLKLEELMALCTTLQNRVLDLEKIKTTQANEIASLKRRVKKLEKKNRSRTHKLKRLYKVGLTARIKSSRDKENDTDKEMFDVDALNGEEVFVAGQNENVVKEVVDAAQVSTDAITTKEITLAQALEALKTSKLKVKGIVFQDPAEFDKEERLAREKAEKEQEANIALIETWDDIQARIDVDHQLAERLQAQEQ